MLFLMEFIIQSINDRTGDAQDGLRVMQIIEAAIQSSEQKG
jgi:hypothetical protein